MQTVGDYLKKEREAKNISLGEVSRVTKISKFYLDFLEKDDYEKLPQGPYIKGYISSYAKLIGSNADEALRLYDALYKQKKQTEAVQPKISKNEGWQAAIALSPKSIFSLLNNKTIQPEKAKSKGREASGTPFHWGIGSSFNAVASTLKAKASSLKPALPLSRTIVAPFKRIPASSKTVVSSLKAVMASSKTIVRSLKAVGTSIKTIVPLIQKSSSSLRTIVPSLQKATAALSTNVWLFNKRNWLYACFVLFSSTILVLVGFGFYHLFIYQNNPPLAANLQVLQDKGSKAPLAAINGKKNILPSRSNDAFISADQLSSKVAAELSDETSLPAEKTASEGITAGKEISARSRQRPISPSLAPKSISAFNNLNVLNATICGDIKDRMPTGMGNSFPWSTHRVYVWNLVEAKHLPSKIRHIYYFEGQKISDVALNVRSPYWRTWSYKTISNTGYKGAWRVDIASAKGQVLRSLNFKID